MSTTNRTTDKKSTFRKVSEWLHLWLGLFSGIIVFTVCLTGGIWVWRYEVWYFTEKYQQVNPQQKPFLLPSQLESRALNFLEKKGDTGARVTNFTYGTKKKAAIFSFDLPEDKHTSIYLNPYNGIILKDKREGSTAENFFIFIRAGHRFFWLPQKIGSPVVGSACIIFVITLITGLIWWYPKKWNAKIREKSFSIKWGAKWKRLNIDLHNVLGFYSFIFVILLTLTGIVFTFDWFEKGVYRTLTWKKPVDLERSAPLSDTLAIRPALPAYPEDRIFERLNRAYGGKFSRMSFSLPEENKEPYKVFVNFGDGTQIYDMDFHYFDRYSLKPIQGTGNRTSSYASLGAGEKLFRMNFDIHTGQILGLPTKIIAFLACIIGASMPVTGFIIWYNRKWGKKRNKAKKVG